jgi:hypothetical protein
MLALVLRGMTEAQLNIRSTKASTLARKLAKQQRRTVSQVVELALEQFAKSSRPSKLVNEESASDFWDRIHRTLYPTGNEPDIDLEAIILENRQFQRPVDL